MPRILPRMYRKWRKGLSQIWAILGYQFFNQGMLTHVQAVCCVVFSVLNGCVRKCWRSFVKGAIWKL